MTIFKKRLSTLPWYTHFSKKIPGKGAWTRTIFKFHLTYWQFVALLAINNLSGFLFSIRHLVDKIPTYTISDSTVLFGHFKHLILMLWQTLSLKINTALQISQRRNGILILFKNSFKTLGVFFPSLVKIIIDFSLNIGSIFLTPSSYSLSA